jgi:hypothetical protein
VLAGTKPNGASAVGLLVVDTLVGGRVFSKEEIPYNEGLIVGLPVIFAGPILPPFLFCVLMLTEAVVVKAAMTTTATVIWVAIDLPAAAVLIVLELAAADIPADEAAWTAID